MRKLTALLLFLLILHLPVTAQPGGGGPAPVVVEKAVLERVAPVVTLPGTSAALKRSRVASAQEGIVLKRRVWFSESKKKGDIIIELDSSEAQAHRDAAAAQAEVARAQLDEAVAGERPERIAAQRAEVARAKADFQEARQSWDRARSLFEKSAVSENERDTARAQFQAARASLESAQAQLRLLEAGTRKEIVGARRASWKQAEAMLAAAQKRFDDMTIRLPFDGDISEVFIEEGDWLEKGGAICELVHSAYIDVGVLIPQRRIDDIIKDRVAEVDFPSSSGTVTVTGTIAALGPQAMAKGRTVPIIVRFKNDRHGIRPGMSCIVRLPIGEEVERVLIPKDAVVSSTSGSNTVYAVVDGKATPRTVELGRQVDQRVEVLSGIQAGDTVVTRGNERLRPGMAVAPSGAGAEPRAGSEPPPGATNK